MAETKIEWCDKVWNPTEQLEQPLKWRKPQKIFVSSMINLFREDVPFDYIDRIFAVMALCPQHTFQVLTKRPDRMQSYISTMDEFSLSETDEWRDAQYRVDCDDDPDGSTAWHCETARIEDAISLSLRALRERKYLPNVWLGVTVENQDQDWRIKYLLETPAAIRFISVEPMLGEIDLTQAMYGEKPMGMNCFGFTDGFGYEAMLHWVICGPETGPGKRPMKREWILDLYRQCADAGVPFFDKKNILGLNLKQFPEAKVK